MRPYVECLATTGDAIQDDNDEVKMETQTSDIIDWKKEQQQETTLKYWIQEVQNNKKPVKDKESTLKRQYHHLKIREGILY